MNKDQFTNLILKAVSLISAAAVQHGWGTASTWQLVAEAAPGLAALIYSHFWAAQPPSTPTIKS